ncbi:5-oxoprolinase subunit C family protein [Verminephrobacter aporrectodeae]|uniref:5-oxoprolinase subunit C family protein n=1 Tax=Verminephrobacter aporrectodeae TaxID=1110389 RepID=UPI002244BBCF|nr:biotin-dependent carboxyltransferase family protein [Verminephrobacter aporrectodeae]MCW8163345.1 biotin-dependent carboxyltransferase [Verminephrobacter aporrectodeae subsp. tuberculatae]MCW8167574.1 biotin-dependent carboxyltransferase [Verminephrobacter aporrectodeae subsp. tuberculatae]MCW8173893.1 biotin-dependent carboxyltransferase [Verminephrobacter aporrectodeae subsp. tuberculatae]MCW8197087.1 biotin-dependent carboxyltransferase [Verminephrobacter aporrectodeae subsp. tuberculatae
MAIEVIKPGLASSVQDAGRPGFYHLGIPLSGALDQQSYLLANLLVGNAADAAVIECTLLGPELRFHAPAVVAVTGAEAAVLVDGQDMPRNESFAVPAGARLGFGFMKLGARCFIAVAGGIDVPRVLGSRSTYGLGAFGGFQGRRLLAGDRLPLGERSPHARAGRRAQAQWLPALAKEVPLRVLPGLYFHRLQEASAAGFFADTWTVASEADRIGYRCKGGRPLQFHARTPPFGAGADPSNIVDAGYPYGSIQVPGGSEPIILHRDAVSGGGYAMIGTVISADMDRIAQMQPNNQARFVAVDMAQALEARAERSRRLQQMRDALTH